MKITLTRIARKGTIFVFLFSLITPAIPKINPKGAEKGVIYSKRIIARRPFMKSAKTIESAWMMKIISIARETFPSFVLGIKSLLFICFLTNLKVTYLNFCSIQSILGNQSQKSILSLISSGIMTTSVFRLTGGKESSIHSSQYAICF